MNFAFTLSPPTPTLRRSPLVCKKRPSRRARPKGPKPDNEKLARPWDDGLVSNFESDSRKPLSRSRSKPTKPKSKPPKQSNEFVLPTWTKVNFAALKPTNRSEALELLIRGSWFGIGTLVAYFFFVHFVLVRDLIPHAQP